MELVESLGAKVNKCSYINEYINFFWQYWSGSSFDLQPINRFIQMMSLYLWPVYSGEQFRASGPSCLPGALMGKC